MQPYRSNAPVALALKPTQGELRQQEARRRWRRLWLLLLSPLVLVACWPILLVAAARGWMSYARPGWSPAWWLPLLEGVGVFLMVWDTTGTPFPAHAVRDYAVAQLAWTVATAAHVRDGLPLWHPAYAADLWWLVQHQWLSTLVAVCLLDAVPGFPRWFHSFVFPHSQRTNETIRPTFLTAEQLVTRPAVVDKGLWGPHFAAGTLTLFVAPEKGGKSTLFSQLFGALVRGTPFMGLPVRPVHGTSVLVATEEHSSVYQGKAAEAVASAASARDRHQLHVLSSEHVGGHLDAETWPAVLQAIGSHAGKVQARLVVIDTAAHYLPGAESHTLLAQHAAGALKHLTAAGLAVVLIHHTNAAGRSRGARALPAAADFILTLATVTGDERLRRLSATGRYQGLPPADLVYRMDDAGRLALVEEGESQDAPGDAQADAAPAFGRGVSAPSLTLDPACTAILTWLREAPEGGAERIAIQEAVRMASTAVYEHLKHLTEAGLLVTTGTGRRGSPRVYWLPERVPAEAAAMEPAEAEETEARILAAVRKLLAEGQDGEGEG